MRFRTYVLKRACAFAFIVASETGHQQASRHQVVFLHERKLETGVPAPNVERW